jgi:hypothetical protein
MDKQRDKTYKARIGGMKDKELNLLKDEKHDNR